MAIGLDRTGGHGRTCGGGCSCCCCLGCCACVADNKGEAKCAVAVAVGVVVGLLCGRNKTDAGGGAIR